MERHCKKRTRLFQHGIPKKQAQKYQTFKNHTKRKHKGMGFDVFFLRNSVFGLASTSDKPNGCL